jgi:hypothetical protein
MTYPWFCVKKPAKKSFKKSSLKKIYFQSLWISEISPEQNDKSKIHKVIAELDEKKKETLKVTWVKVNK